MRPPTQRGGCGGESDQPEKQPFLARVWRNCELHPLLVGTDNAAATPGKSMAVLPQTESRMLPPVLCGHRLCGRTLRTGHSVTQASHKGHSCDPTPSTSSPPPQGLCTTVPSVCSSAAEISSRSCWSQRDITSAECGFICFFTLASVCTHATCVCWNVGVTLPLLSWLWEPLSDPELVLRRLQSGCMNESVGE